MIIEDPRVKGLYVGGYHTADEYSDVDLSIFFETEEDRQSFKKDRFEIAQKIGEIKAETMDSFEIEIYIIIYEPEEVKVDLSFKLLPSKHRQERLNVSILYDLSSDDLLRKIRYSTRRKNHIIVIC